MILNKPHLCDELDRWNRCLGETCGDFRARLNPMVPVFIGNIEHQKTHHLEMALIRTNASQIVHRCANHHRHDDRHCFLVMQRSGRMQMAEGGRHAFEMQPGEMMLMDSIAPCDLVPNGVVDLVSIHLKRDALKCLLPPGQRLFGKITAHTLSGQILHGMLKQLSQWPSEAEGQTLHEVMALLLAQSLHAAPPAARLGAQTGQDYLRRCADELIEQQLDNALLTPALLAQRLGISVRQLYRLFDDTDSICRHIQHKRLLRSAEDLSSAHLRHQSITQIAYRWGFTDAAHFSRAFKKHFACTPREYRLRQHSAALPPAPALADTSIRWQPQSNPWHPRSIPAPARMPESAYTK